MPRVKSVSVLAFALTLGLVSVGAAADKIPGIGPVGQIQKVDAKFQFTEGPASDRQGNIYFSDIPANKIFKLDSAGKVEEFLDPSGHSNGLMFNAKGTLFACQMDGKIVSIDVKTKKTTDITAEHDGKRYNAPNDLVVDKAGGVYFTDPRFRAPEPWPQGVEAVYYASADGKVTRLVSDLKAPNGVILSPDEKTLYVIPSLQKEMMEYPIEAPGKLGKGRVFCSLQQKPGSDNGGGDGLTVDEKGNLYITSGLGLQVYDPKGKHLGNIEFPEQPANVTFGGKDNKTLYVTARSSVYYVQMEVAGHQFPGK
ncbi:MAG TPA: SMP-30/gluconolactonase/LRE family protein [Planctomycetaceae bacterium]|nr:SMP-30/gluconolactonase/LRE family protein [Planctomycetaceae bacterium]